MPDMYLFMPIGIQIYCILCILQSVYTYVAPPYIRRFDRGRTSASLKDIKGNGK